MNNNINNRVKIPTEFEPDVRFVLSPSFPVVFKGNVEDELERLKNRMLREKLEKAEPEIYAPLRRAANEAASIAWSTTYPLLVFPLLFEELAAKAVRFFKKQNEIKEKTAELIYETV